MAKIIELSEYRKNKNKKQPTSSKNNPVLFYELNEGVKNLALKNQATIVTNVKEYMIDNYHSKLNKLMMKDFEYSFDTFLIENLELTLPFAVNHGVQFSRNHYLSMISDHDWTNLIDIIVRISLNSYYHLLSDVDPYEMAIDYTWTSVIVDIPNV